MDTVEPRIVSAVGIAVHSDNQEMADAMVSAGSKAVEQAMADGLHVLHDAEEVSRRLNAAMDEVRSAYTGKNS